jgi:TP901 family phage tail tape measure protein
MAVQEVGIRLVALDSRRFNRAVKSADDVVADLRSELNATARTARRSGGDIDGLSATMAAIPTGAVVAGTTAIAAGIGAIGVASVSAAADFEQSMARVGAVSGATTEELEELEAVAKEMGSTTVFSARQAADGMSFLAMAGFDVNETIDAMPGVLNLAAAGQMELARTSDIASNVLSGFRLNADQMTRVSDVMAATMTSANTNIEQLGFAMSYAAPIAADMGISIEETAAAIGRLSDAGIQGERAGTALRGIMLTLSAPTASTRNAMEDLNIAVTDAQGEFLPLADIVGQFEERLDGMTDAQRSAALGTVFTTEQIGAFNVLLGVGSDELASYTDELEASGGAAESLAGQQMATFQGAMTELQSAVEGVAIEVGQELLPVMTELTRDVLIPFVRTYGPELVNQTAAFAQEVTDLYAILKPLLDLMNNESGPESVRAALAVYRGEYAEATGTVIDAVGAANRSAADFATVQATALQDVVTEMQNLDPAAEDAAGAVDAFGNAVSVANEELESMREAARDAGLRAFRDAVQTEVDFLAEREDAHRSHRERMVDITADGEERRIRVQQDLAESEERFQRDTAENQARMAEELAEAETQAERQAAYDRHNERQAAIDERIIQAREANTEELQNLETANAEKAAAEAEAFAEQERIAAEAYARQQAEQMAHLGQMLIDYATAQAEMNGVSADALAEMTSQIADEYGVQQSLTERSFGDMTRVIDQWATSGGNDANRYIGSMRDVQSAATATQQQVNARIEQLTRQATEAFQRGELGPEQYAQRLQQIPGEARASVEGTNNALRQLTTEMITAHSLDSTAAQDVSRIQSDINEIPREVTTIHRIKQQAEAQKRTATASGGGGAAVAGARARGGPVGASALYEVTEPGVGPELLTFGGRQYLMTPPTGTGEVSPLDSPRVAMPNTSTTSTSTFAPVVNLNITTSGDMGATTQQIAAAIEDTVINSLLSGWNRAESSR